MTSGSKDKAEDDRIDVQPVDLEPTRRGYQVTYNYAVHFWLPILGPRCFAVWQALISFCFGDRDTCWPSISLLADMAARGDRNLITGRWRGKGDSRRRQKGALETLEDYGLLTVETRHAGPETRHTFHVLKEPPILPPDLVAELPKRLRQMHSDLLDRCGLDEETYPHIHRGAAGRGSRGAALGSTKHYKESITLEEIWKEAKNALSREMTESNFRTDLSDTHALAFDRNRGLLIVQTPNPLTTETLTRQFRPTITRAIRELDLRFRGVPVHTVAFTSPR